MAPLRFALACLATLSLIETAEAAGPKWKIGKDEAVRYRIETDNKGGGVGLTPVMMPAAILVHARSIEGDLLFAEPVDGVPALIFHYLLSIPSGKKGKGVVQWMEKHEKVAPYSLDLQSTARAKVDGDNSAQIEGEAVFSQLPKQILSYECKGGSLKWVAAFDGKQGCFVNISYEFTMDLFLKSANPPQNMKQVASGRLILIDKGKRSVEQIKKEIDSAIEKGVTFLKSGGRGMNSRMGYLALSLFALLRSGVPPQDTFIEQGFQSLAKMPKDYVYDVSLYIMALEARTIRRNPPEGLSTIPRFERGALPRDTLSKIQELTNWLLEARNKGKGSWHYKQPGQGEGGAVTPAGSFDNSNTQFAVLALDSAHRAGAKVDPAVWLEIFNHFKGCQSPGSGSGNHVIARSNEEGAKDGKDGKKKGAATVARGGPGTQEKGPVPYRGWAYGQSGNAYGSMTNAGLSSLAIAADLLKATNQLSPALAADFQRMVAEGLNWVAENYSITKNAGQGDSWYFYYMYSLEKACELLAIDSFDGREWFLEGADHICALQQANGSWANQDSETALALLFLNRATIQTTVNILPKRSATGLGRGNPTDRTTILIEKAGGLISLNELARSLKNAPGAERGKRQKWFEDGLPKLEEASRPLVMPELIALLDDKNLKPWAKKYLREITGDSALKDEEYQPWYDRWSALDSAEAEHAYERIGLIAEVLAKDKNALLRQVAILAAVRLRAVELVPSLALLLERPKEKKLIEDCLSVFMDRKPTDRKDAETWYAESGAKSLAAQQPRRKVARAAKGDEALRKELIAAGKTYLDELVRVARDEKIGQACSDLLQTITGEKVPGEGWPSWWQTNKDKVGADGKLPPAPGKKP